MLRAHLEVGTLAVTCFALAGQENRCFVILFATSVSVLSRFSLANKGELKTLSGARKAGLAEQGQMS